MKAIIVDDEHNGREGLKNILESFFAAQVTVVAMGRDVASAVEAIALHQPDLVFLDIHMPDGTGFDVLQQTQDNNPFHAVFITGHHELALKAFDYSAFDYLLKPVGIKVLRGIIETLTEAKKTGRGNNPHLQVLVENYGSAAIHTLVVPTLTGFERISIKDLLRVYNENETAVFLLRDQTVLQSTQAFKKYETLLSANGFLRVNSTTSINLHETKKTNKEDVVEMSDGSAITIDPDRKNIFAQRFTSR